MAQGSTNWSPVGWMKDTNRTITVAVMIMHFLHPLLCIANYLDWVRHQTDSSSLGKKMVSVYLAMSIIAALFYLLIASVFY
eukprot:gene9686-3070_t